MTGPELTAADLDATRIAPDEHPIAHLRPELDRHGIVPIAGIGRIWIGAGSPSPDTSPTANAPAPPAG